MLPFQTVIPLFTPVEVHIAIYSKHTTVAAARNLNHIAPCEGKNLPDTESMHTSIRICSNNDAVLDIKFISKKSNNVM